MTTIKTGGDMNWPALSDTIPPYINLNGETADSWLRKLTKARNELGDALLAISQCRPHGRDYQTVPRGTYDAALAQYYRRVFCLQRVDAELFMIMTKIVDRRDNPRPTTELLAEDGL